MILSLFRKDKAAGANKGGVMLGFMDLGMEQGNCAIFPPHPRCCALKFNLSEKAPLNGALQGLGVSEKCQRAANG
jgi:hypothetical protein